MARPLVVSTLIHVKLLCRNCNNFIKTITHSKLYVILVYLEKIKCIPTQQTPHTHSNKRNTNNFPILSLSREIVFFLSAYISGAVQFNCFLTSIYRGAYGVEISLPGARDFRLYFAFRNFENHCWK